jgi:hypothetical protein
MSEPTINTPSTQAASPTPTEQNENDSPFIIHHQPVQNQILVHAFQLALNNTPTTPLHYGANTQQQNQGVRRMLKYD